MFTVIIFIIILGLLVFVHELGHFLVARRNGVEVQEFGFGFPPRILGAYRNREGRWRIFRGSKDIRSSKTVYSLNWIPLGGFVKITGEDGEEKENPNSFSAKTPAARIRILAAGVVMNFLLAAILFSASFASGVPQPLEEAQGRYSGSGVVQVIDVGKNTPAEAMGLRAGDVMLGGETGDKSAKFSTVEEVQNFIKENQGTQMTLDIKRGKEELTLSGVPRTNFPEGEGSLGIALSQIVEVKYPWYQALYLGFQYTLSLTATFVTFLFGLIWRLVSGRPAGLVDVSGPVGIAVLTGQVAQLGFGYLVRFTAMLSLNLAIINLLPIPALDGGRIFFTAIERIKGSPISQRLEQRAHSMGFALLITLMILVTVRDFLRFDLIDKIKNLL